MAVPVRLIVRHSNNVLAVDASTLETSYIKTRTNRVQPVTVTYKQQAGCAYYYFVGCHIRVIA